MTTTPGSPRATPSAMNCTAIVLLPDPTGPATRIPFPRSVSPPEHLVETCDPRRNQFRRHVRLYFLDRLEHAGKRLHTTIGNADGVKSRLRRVSSHFLG